MMEAIVALLNELGATADEIASALIAERITAKRGATSFFNPIVRLINRNLYVGGRIHIPPTGGLLTLSHEGKFYTVQLPKPVSRFLDRFHAGDFPLLEER
jgi:hypothetical protein